MGDLLKVVFGWLTTTTTPASAEERRHRRTVNSRGVVALVLLGGVAGMFVWRSAGAEEEFREVLRAIPGRVDSLEDRVMRIESDAAVGRLELRRDLNRVEVKVDAVLLNRGLDPERIAPRGGSSE